MSALTILIVVVAAIPYTLELQSKPNLNDVITWLYQPESTKGKDILTNNQIEQDVNDKSFIKALIKKVSKLIQHENENNLNYYNKIHSSTVDNQPLDIHNDDRGANNIQVHNQYLSVKPHWLKSLGMKRKSNYQLDQGHGGNNFYEDARNNDFTDYSKIYLVLNPEANLEKSDIRDLSNLISSMFSKANIDKKSSMANHSKGLNRQLVLKDIRRRIRESKEVFSPKETMEHEHKPKRGRNEYTGARGRTGIPYVRHRGDVYERE